MISGKKLRNFTDSNKELKSSSKKYSDFFYSISFPNNIEPKTLKITKEKDKIIIRIKKKF